ncbi:PhoX family phosphatase [Rhodobacteraceae bacterium M382]|nr:PhoX family phosphatase [Rhodobacteraceae bacterium M382]
MRRKDIEDDPTIGNRSEAYEAFDDLPKNPDLNGSIGDLIATRYGRRDLIGGLLGVSATAALFGATALPHPTSAATVRTSGGRFVFDELTWGIDHTHHVAPGYTADILVRWGDPITPGAPAFDVFNQSATAQLQQFGYNNDYVGFVQLDETGNRGLLCVNHEYTNEEMMFPNLGRQDRADFAAMTRALVDIEMAAHGGSVVEITKSDDGAWAVDLKSPLNRRISPLNTEMAIGGPAAGHPRMRTNADPSGTRVIGTLNNCAGGMTPWGTWLMAEENFHGYFWTDELDWDGDPDLSEQPHADSLKRYGIPGRWYAWGKVHDRFNLDRTPHEPNRFGWVVEVDPQDPQAMPVKHTALGRFSHEGADPIVAKSGHLVVYMGDDARFEYVYKYVSNGVITDDSTPSSDLLSNGVLHVARFEANGDLNWLPLVFGEGPLTPDNGFDSQADVLIDTRLAADALGATPMDRPEDVGPRSDGRAFVMLTNNSRRKPDQVDAANPRAKSKFGHIIEIAESGGDHAARQGRWSILVKCGDPGVASVGAEWHPDTSENGWFGSPDNCAIDAEGRLWVATDQGSKWHRTGKADGLYGVETDGAMRGRSKLFFRAPVGAEVAGPCFTPDIETLFVSVQHPGTDGTTSLKGFERVSTFDDPATRWPDFAPDMPPRPSVVVVRKIGGGKIGE